MAAAATVGVVGAGIMGGAIARNLIAAGDRVQAYDIDPARLDLLARDGGTTALSPVEAALGAAVLLTSLPSASALEATVTSLLAGAQAGLVVAELSTLPIADKERGRDRLAERGIVMLDCPLSGTGARRQRATSRPMPAATAPLLTAPHRSSPGSPARATISARSAMAAR